MIFGNFKKMPVSYNCAEYCGLNICSCEWLMIVELTFAISCGRTFSQMLIRNFTI